MANKFIKNLKRKVIEWSLNTLQKEIYSTALKQGWWDKPRTNAEVIALIHSEVSETLEAYRKGQPQSKKINASEVEEELADTVIRIMDLCQHEELDLASAIQAKLEYNKQRPYRHGKKF